MEKHQRNLFLMAKKGDIEAYEALVETYQRRIFTLALASVGNRSQASEVAQDIFVTVYKELRNEKSENGLSRLIYGAARKRLYPKGIATNEVFGKFNE